MDGKKITFIFALSFNANLDFMTLEEANLVAAQIQTLDFPYIRAQVSTLGGENRPSVMVALSFDAPDTWKNGIYENSRYMRFHISHTGTVECFTKKYSLPTFRKTTAKTATGTSIFEFFRNKVQKYRDNYENTNN